jgi:hypothetical protein
MCHRPEQNKEYCHVLWYHGNFVSDGVSNSRSKYNSLTLSYWNNVIFCHQIIQLSVLNDVKIKVKLHTFVDKCALWMPCINKEYQTFLF